MGGSFEVFVLGSHVAALQHKGLWQDIYQAWLALQGVMQVHVHGVNNLSPFEGSTLGGNPVGTYSIRSGSLFIMEQKVSLISHDKWSAEDPTCLLDWPSLWPAFVNATKFVLPVHRVLWWRILHHNLFTAVRLHHVNPGISELCLHCEQVPESIGHLFWGCPDVTSLWSVSYSLLSSLLPGIFTSPPTLSHILCPFTLAPQEYVPVVASLHAATYWVIWRAHCSFVFDNTPYNLVSLRLSLLSLIKQNITSVFHVAKQNSRLAQFELTWCCSTSVSLDDAGLLSISLGDLPLS
jgi:hypothetical protein